VASTKSGSDRTKETNLENVRELNKNAQIRKRFQSSQLHTTDHELLKPPRKKQNFTVANKTATAVISMH